jgi:hypothetical protein
MQTFLTALIVLICVWHLAMRWMPAKHWPPFVKKPVIPCSGSCFLRSRWLPVAVAATLAVIALMTVSKTVSSNSNPFRSAYKNLTDGISAVFRGNIRTQIQHCPQVQ